MSQESKYPLNNEKDEPALSAVYIILILTTIFLAVTIIGLRTYEGMIIEKQREAIEKAPTTELNEMRDANAANMNIVDKILLEQAKTK